MKTKSGIILINKEKGISSFQEIQRVRRKLNIKKIGHAGTLDPLATGLLVVLINSATKLSDYLLNLDKEYLVEVIVGIGTNSYDLDGEIISKKEVKEELNIDDILNSFLGEYMQEAPIFSAISQDGEKLYKKARRGEDVELPQRLVEIKSIERVGDVIYQDNKAIFSFLTTVSKGTYIRSLVNDLGKKLNYPATVSNLCRTKISDFDLKDAYKVEDLDYDNLRIISNLDALKDYKQYNLATDEYDLVKHGRKINLKLEEEIVVLKYNNQLVGIYEKDNGLYKARRIWDNEGN
ncbi:MAG TPA: tRNA pseudouridine(55) synthase TruB [Bacilli bacterium]|jgi:tRNA pseudouridine55 synthase|nr:tRNA pseudouridine(55) synthase TruB [Bacilli bacterium]HQO93348.1 tRNA pseudouridine(55) synthase TruB [Bacilli bacterium]HQQ38855.1 tRNA pseudouridine(55) synthase TruB [Bacilli bacterium]